MKSFKNSYIRNNNLVELQNTSFESPLITTNSYLYCYSLQSCMVGFRMVSTFFIAFFSDFGRNGFVEN